MLYELVNNLKADTKLSLLLFSPELTLCVTILVMLLVRMIDSARRIESFYIALVGSVIALVIPWTVQPWEVLSDPANAEVIQPREIFTGMLVYDSFTVFMRAVLLIFAVLFVIFTRLSGIPDKEDAADFYTLFLGATLGMCLMASANHLLMVFLAVEIASVPSYVLAGILKGRRRSSEAALKYSVYGAGAAGIMLYGISLIAGVVNSAHLPTIARELAANMPSFGGGEITVLSLGGLMIAVGLAFKLSAVPFHFWCPDVFEGATAEVNAFLSISSKAAALALLVRVAFGFGAAPSHQPPPVAKAENAVAAAAPLDGARFVLAAEAEPEPAAAPSAPAEDGKQSAAKETSPSDAAASGAGDPLQPVRFFIVGLIAFLAAITCTFGNLAAYAQTNIKRLMAYSTIAHAGYMMMPVAAAVALAEVAPEAARDAIGSLALYIAIYLFMNLGAFAIIAFLRNAMGSEEIADYAGLIRRAPGVVICFGLILFSLIGLPPLAGFMAKLRVFGALADGYSQTGYGSMVALLVIGGVNTAISLFYYLRVVKVMTLDPEPEDRLPVDLPLVTMQGFYTVLVTLPVAVLILSWDGLNRMAVSAAAHLLP